MIKHVCEKCGEVFYTKNKTKRTKCVKCRSSEYQKEYYQKKSKNKIINTKQVDNSLGVLLRAMHDLFTNFSKEYNKNYNEVHTKDLETQDLLHEIELEELSDKELFDRTEKLKTVRKERRKAKDRVEELKIIRSFVDKYNQKFIIKDLALVIKQYEEYIENMKKRTYTHKVKDEEVID